MHQVSCRNDSPVGSDAIRAEKGAWEAGRGPRVLLGAEGVSHDPVTGGPLCLSSIVCGDLELSTDSDGITSALINLPLAGQRSLCMSSVYVAVWEGRVLAHMTKRESSCIQMIEQGEETPAMQYQKEGRVSPLEEKMGSSVIATRKTRGSLALCDGEQAVAAPPGDPRSAQNRR